MDTFSRASFVGAACRCSVRANRRRGAEPDGWTAGSRYQAEWQIPPNVEARGREALDEAWERKMEGDADTETGEHSNSGIGAAATPYGCPLDQGPKGGP